MVKKAWKAQADKQTDRQTDKKDSNFFKGTSIWKCYLQNDGHFFRPNYRLIWCLFFIKVYHQPKLKREITLVHISKISEQNPVSVTKKNPDRPTFSTSSKRLQDPKWKSRLCLTICVISYQTLANACANQLHQYVQFAKYTIQNIIQFNIETMCWTEKIYSIKYFRNISWDIYMSIISQNKIYPHFA